MYDTAGIKLSESKKELVKSRLSKRLRKLGIATFSQYFDFVTKIDTTGVEFTNMVNSITTNKTEFFREIQHFHFLQSVILPELIAKSNGKGTKTIRIWSAGCSSGEEPYTIGMVLHRFFEGKPGWNIKILATDICTDVLHSAQDGVFHKKHIENIPSEFLRNYFQKTKLHPRLYNYRIKDCIREMVIFRKFNLMAERYPFINGFDMIFCRNVMIYFDRPTQQRLINKFHHHLKKGGHLLIGHSESLTSIKSDFVYQQPATYKKKD